MSALRDALRDLPDPVYADLLEGEDAYLLVIDLPGVTSETVDARVEGPRLVIEARREKDVPPDAAGAEASGSVEQGVLELHLPKQSATRGMSVPIDD
jgi:HSP20 family protein